MNVTVMSDECTVSSPTLHKCSTLHCNQVVHISRVIRLLIELSFFMVSKKIYYEWLIALIGNLQ